MTKEGNREDEQASSPEETEEEETTTEATEEETETTEEETETEQEIDFEKELEALENTEVDQGTEETTPPAPKKKTEEEKAGYTARETIKRLKKQGKTDEQISKIIGFKVVTESEEEPEEEDETTEETTRSPGFVTQKDLDLRDARQEASRLSRSAAEEKVIMWYVVNKNLSVHDAHLLANKGRVRRSQEEIERGQQRGGTYTPPGRRTPKDVKPKFTAGEMEIFNRRGMKWNPTSKRMEGKFTFVRIDETGKRITGRLEKK